MKKNKITVAEEYAENVAFRVPYDGSKNYYDDKVYDAAKTGFEAGQSFSRERAIDAICKTCLQPCNSEKDDRYLCSGSIGSPLEDFLKYFDNKLE